LLPIWWSFVKLGSQTFADVPLAEIAVKGSAAGDDGSWKGEEAQHDQTVDKVVFQGVPPRPEGLFSGTVPKDPAHQSIA